MIGRALAETENGHPDFIVRGIVVDDGLVTVEGQRGAFLVRDRANRAWFDAQNGRSLGNADAQAMSVHQRVSEAADPLHFGTWGGLPSKLVWFSFGLILTALSITGVLTCAYRLAGSGARLPAFARAAGLWGLAGVVLIVHSLVRLFW